jgi:hypothetical protein
MSHTLRLTDGTTTVDLSSGIVAYAPMPPDQNEEKVTESIIADITGANIAAAQTTIRSIENLLAQAKRFQQSERGPRVYLEFDPGATGTVYRAEILEGKLDIAKDALGWMFAAFDVEATITFTRRGTFQASSEIELTPGGGVDIYNHDDAGTGHDNFVDIAAANLSGADRIPVRLEIKNTYNVSPKLGTLFVGVNAFKGTAMPTHVLEGESATGMTNNADANSSNGNYGSKTWTGDAATLAATWTLSASDLNKLAGHKYHLLMRTPLSDGGINITVKACYAGTTTALAETQEILCSASLVQDLGFLALPPYLESETDLYALDLLVYVRKTGGGTVYCDFLQMTPTDGYRVYRSLAVGVPYNATLKDEAAITDRVWVEGVSGTARVASYIAEGEPIKLYANRDNRIIILAMNDAGGCEIARTFNVKVFGRPQRLTL